MDKVDTAVLEAMVLVLLDAIGEDTTRSGLEDTPRRVAKFWLEFIDYDSGNLEVTFSDAPLYDQLVVVRDIEFYSLCEHHLLPFIGKAHVGYLADGAVPGLSKIARVVQKHAHRLQIQERMTIDIASELRELFPSLTGVGVVIEAEHLCVKMRGVKTPSLMTTSALLGELRDSNVKAEFLSLVRGGAG